MKRFSLFFLVVALALSMCACAEQEITMSPTRNTSPTADSEPTQPPAEALPQPKVMFLGDSITRLGTSERGWVKYFLEAVNGDLIVNTAVNGACLHDKAGTVYDGEPVFNGQDGNFNNVLGNQVQKILNGSYDEPDMIVIMIGTNDGISITQEQMRQVYYREDGSKIPLEEVDRKTSAGAYRYCLEKLHERYPDAVIFWCAPVMGCESLRTPEFIVGCTDSLRIATEYTGQIMIETLRCGINGADEIQGANGDYLQDGLHPNAEGAKKIGYYIATMIKPYIEAGFVDCE